MEINKLNGFVLLVVLLGMILGVSVIIFDAMYELGYGTGTITDEQITALEGVNVSIANGNFTAFFAENATNAAIVPTTNYTLHYDEGYFEMKAGNKYFNDTLINLTYTYKNFEGGASPAMQGMTAAVSPIATTWLPLIITIFMLGIILFLVIQSFRRTD